MGNSLSSSSAYDAAEETKDEINRRCDSYVAFAELTESLVDIELDDLREEIASVIEAFLPNVVSLSSKESSFKTINYVDINCISIICFDRSANNLNNFIF